MISDIKIGITGLPGAGKTTALLRVIDMLKDEELSIGGMINEPVVEGRYRVGFTTRNLITGEKATFAQNGYESKIMVGKMGVDIEALEYFFNMLSEGSNRQVQSMLHHIDEKDDFGIMLATAQYDTIGAVTIKPI